MKLREFLHLYRDSASALRVLRSTGMLCESKRCICGSMMRDEYDRCSDGMIFRCKSSACRKKTSIRDGSFFANSKLPLHEQMLLIHLFAKNYPERLVLDDFEFASHTVVDWYR